MILESPKDIIPKKKLHHEYIQMVLLQYKLFYFWSLIDFTFTSFQIRNDRFHTGEKPFEYDNHKKNCNDNISKNTYEESYCWVIYLIMNILVHI